MEILSKLYTSIQRTLFPMLEEEIGGLTVKQKEFVRVVELVRPSRFIGVNLSWNGMGRPMSSREGILRAFILKAVYDLPTTKLLIENLDSNYTYNFEPLLPGKQNTMRPVCGALLFALGNSTTSKLQLPPNSIIDNLINKQSPLHSIGDLKND